MIDNSVDGLKSSLEIIRLQNNFSGKVNGKMPTLLYTEK